MRLGKRVMVVAGFQLALVAGFLLLTARLSSSQDALECVTPGPAVDVESLGDISARMRVEEPAPLVFTFRGGRGVQRDKVPLPLVEDSDNLPQAVRPRPGESLAVRLPHLVDNTNHQKIPSDKIYLSATFSPNERAVVLDVCVDLRDSKGFGAGSYHGSAALTDGRFREAEVPFDISVKSDRWHLPFLAAVGFGLLGGAWGTISLSFAGTNGEAGARRVGKWQALRLVGIAAVLGCFAGLYVYLQNYEGVDTFRGSAGDVLAVGTAAFVAAAALYPAAAVIEWFIRRLLGKDDSVDSQAVTSISPAPTPEGGLQ